MKFFLLRVSMCECYCTRCAGPIDALRKNSSLTWLRGPHVVKGVFCKDCLNVIQTSACPLLKKDNFVVKFEWKRPFAVVPLPSALACLVMDYCSDRDGEVGFRGISPGTALELRNHLWRAERVYTVQNYRGYTTSFSDLSPEEFWTAWPTWCRRQRSKPALYRIWFDLPGFHEEVRGKKRRR